MAKCYFLAGGSEEPGGVFLLPVNLPSELWGWSCPRFGSAVSGGGPESVIWSWPLYIQLLLPSHRNGEFSLTQIETHNLIITG